LSLDQYPLAVLVVLDGTDRSDAEQVACEQAATNARE